MGSFVLRGGERSEAWAFEPSRVWKRTVQSGALHGRSTRSRGGRWPCSRLRSPRASPTEHHGSPVMKAIFGIVSLLLVLAALSFVAKKQLQAFDTGVVKRGQEAPGKVDDPGRGAGRV